MLEYEPMPWKRFIETGEVEKNTLDPIIERSWKRCVSYEVNYDRPREGDVLTLPQLTENLEENYKLVAAASPAMEDLFTCLRQKGFMVILADHQGYILKCLLDKSFEKYARKVSLVDGANWGEFYKGTNAIGTSLAEGKPTKVFAEEHYIRENHILACAAAPIFGPAGELLGTLDVTGQGSRGNEVIFSLVKLAARSISQELRLIEMEQKLAGVEARQRFQGKSLTANRELKTSNTQGLRYNFDNILAESKSMQSVIKVCKRVAPSEATLLISGETGTGKEMLAQAIHQKSSRSSGPFVALNCSAIPSELVESELFGYEEGAFTGAVKGGRVGKFEAAEGGTIFLDEIGDMPLQAQTSLLRVLQEKQFYRVGGFRPQQANVRVIAATHQNLAKLIEKGSFRQDLYYRLNVVKVSIPPLRERTEDIIPLASVFLDKFKSILGRPALRFSTEVLECLSNYSWPGNIRELENNIEGLVNIVEGDIITAANLLPELKASVEKGNTAMGERTLEVAEKQTIEQAISACEGNLTATAQQLKIGRTTLYRKMRKYNLESKKMK